MCSCNNGLLLQTDGRSCQCGGRLTAASGSFQTDGWPNAYRRQNFQCEWIIELPDSSATIQFTIDPSAFGIPGRAPACTSDHIEFFDGPRSSASSLKKMCGLRGFYGGTLPTITTSSSTARVVFTGSDHQRPSSRVGVKVDYVSILPVGMCLTHSFLRSQKCLYTTFSAIDCSVNNGGCDHICVTVSDAIECHCREGYNLIDRSTCSGICIYIL